MELSTPLRRGAVTAVIALSAVVPAAAHADSTPRSVVTISGAPIVGQKLTADLDGPSKRSGRYLVRWERCTDYCTPFLRARDKWGFRLERQDSGMRVRVSVYRRTRDGRQLIARSERTTWIERRARPQATVPVTPSPSPGAPAPPVPTPDGSAAQSSDPSATTPPGPSAPSPAAPTALPAPSPPPVEHAITGGLGWFSRGIDNVVFTSPHGIGAVRAIVDGADTPLVSVTTTDVTRGVAALDTTSLSDGTHTIALAITGNDGAERLTAPETFTVDNGAPAAVSNLTITPDSGATITWDPEIDPGPSELIAVSITACDASSLCRTFLRGLGPTVCLNLPAGTYTITVRLRDRAGNTGAAATGSVTIP